MGCRAASGANPGWSHWSICSGSTRRSAVFRLMSLRLREIVRDAHRRDAGALGDASLQHPEAPALDRELDVLHVAVVALEALRVAQELAVGDRHAFLERGARAPPLRLRHALTLRPGTRGAGGDLERRADARDHVLALGVRQILAREPRLARSRRRA